MKKSLLMTVAVIGLFAYSNANAVGVAATEAELLVPTLNRIKAEAQSATLPASFELTEKGYTTTFPEGAVFVDVFNGSYNDQYYFDAGYNKEILNLLVNSPAAIIGGDAASGYTISFDADLFPNSGYSLNTDTTGSNFVITKYLQGAGGVTPKQLAVEFNNPLGDTLDGSGANEATKYYKWVVDATTGDRALAEVSTPTETPIKNYDIVASSSENTRVAHSSDIDFIKNSFISLNETTNADTEGGAIYNELADIGAISGDFINNSVNSTSTEAGSHYVEGGAIWNNGHIESITGNFIGNYALSQDIDTYGGAIYNFSNIDNIIGDFLGNYVVSENSSARAGAISNLEGNISEIIGDFVGNYAFSKNEHAFAGAIFVSSFGSNTIGKITGDFINNYANSTSSNAYGGAIAADYNGIINNIYGDFIGNYAGADLKSAKGGAIYISNGLINNISGDFIGNYVKTLSSVFTDAQGGAIYSSYSRFGSHANISSKDEDIYFSGNYTEYGAVGFEVRNYNAIHLASDSINFAPAVGTSIVFNDGITSFDDDDVDTNGDWIPDTAAGDIFNNINIGDYTYYDNIGEKSIKAGGSVIFNDTVENVNINLNKGSVILGRENQYTDASCVGGGCRDITFDTATLSALFDNVNVNMASGTMLDASNGVIQDTAINTLTLADNTFFGIDLGHNGTTAVSDTFTIANLSESKEVNLSSVVFADSWVDGDYTNVLVFNQNIDVKDVYLYTSTGNYEIIGNGNGTINIDSDTTIKSLTTVMEAPSDKDRLYDMSADEIVATNFGVQKDANVTVQGNGNSIIGNNGGNAKDGAVISAGQEFVLDNVASVEGFNTTYGAISTGGTVTVNAITNSTSFENNVDADIRLDATGVANLNTGVDNSIILNSGVSGDGTINKDGEGALEINEDAGFVGEFNLNEGSVKLSADANDFFANAGALNVFGCMVDVANGTILNTNLGDLTLSSNLELAFDVNLAVETATAGIFESDTFEVANLTNNGAHQILVEKVNVLGSAAAESVKVDISDDASINAILGVATDYVVEGDVYNYDIDSSEIADGILIFNKKAGGGTSDFSSAAYTSSVARNMYYLQALDVSLDVLEDVGLNLIKPKALASGDDFGTWDNAWVKVSSYNEDVNLNGIDVENKTYSAIMGMDTKPVLEDGYVGYYSVYMAYLNSEQEYANVDINQDSVMLGARSVIYKDNLHSALSANFGTSFVDANNATGSEDYEMYSFSLSSKTAYDIDLYCGEHILQPSLTLAYLYSHTPDYDNSAGNNVEADDLHAFRISPEVKLINHHMNNFDTYIAASYNWDITNDADVVVANVGLPEISADPYAEFKAGVSKNFDNGISLQIDVVATTGGRDGFGGNIELKWAF